MPGPLCRTVAGMSAQPAEHDEPYEKIHLGGVEAAIVPIDELRRLRAIERHAPAEAVAEAEAEEAEIAGVYAEYRQWAAGGRQGGMSQEEMDRLLSAGTGR
jgi:hypothetical protein